MQNILRAVQTNTHTRIHAHKQYLYTSHVNTSFIFYKYLWLRGAGEQNVYVYFWVRRHRLSSRCYFFFVSNVDVDIVVRVRGVVGRRAT